MSAVNLPNAIVKAYENAMAQTLPRKSQQKYLNAYEHFDTWRNLNEVERRVDKEVLMAYFLDVSKHWKPTTLWARYSMIKSVLIQKFDVDIGQYKCLTKFLGNKSKGYKPRKAKPLLAHNLKTFLNQAPDEKYLFTKVSSSLIINTLYFYILTLFSTLFYLSLVFIFTSLKIKDKFLTKN